MSVRFAALIYLWAFHLAQASQHRQQWGVVRSAMSMGKNTKRELGREALMLGADNFPFSGASALHGHVPCKGVFSFHELSRMWLF